MFNSTGKGLFAKLGKTRKSLTDGLRGLFGGGTHLEDADFDELEDQLIMADMGADASAHVVQALRDAARREKITDGDVLRSRLADELARILESAETPPPDPAARHPYIILMVGVNGVGKTTTVAKLAHYFKQRDFKVMLAACDTFRAAAIEQLCMWGERTGVDVVRHQQGSDPSAVAYDATKAALARKSDLLLIDTAGRLHNKSNLMEELAKTKRVLSRDIPGAPHETWLVLDGTTGQNALIQARQFMQNIDITGFILTKLDSSSKGGAIIGIVQELGIPVRYIGIGERAEDLRPFDPESFVDAIFNVESAQEEPQDV